MIEGEYVRQIPRKQYEYEQVRINISADTLEALELKLHQARLSVEREMQITPDQLLRQQPASPRRQADDEDLPF